MKLSELITISPGFHRSVNVKYDVHNEEKVASYIPTERAESVMEHMLSAINGDSGEGASMLVGSYGTGKSHLAVLLGSLVGKKVPACRFTPVLDKIKRPEVREQLRRELGIAAPHLVVPISGGTEYDLRQLLLLSLKRTLEENGLEFEIRSSYSAALRFINTWSAEFPATHGALQKAVARSHFRTLDNLVRGLRDFDPSALHFFTDVYPELAAGAQFNYYDGDLADIYREVCVELPRHGYRGMLVIFDEFNKVMDASIRNRSSFKVLQDLAELASRSGESFRLYMLLVSHRTIGQYIAGLGGALEDEWRKIEGRFRIFDVSSKPWEAYDLMSRVLRKNVPDYYDVATSARPELKSVGTHRRLVNLFEGLASDRVDELVIRGCFPLHPVTVFALPRISAKVAQNERTLFTFLAGQDDSPLAEILDRELEEAELVLPWRLYDYFEHQLRRLDDPAVKGIWTKVTNAVESLPHTAEAEIRLLKTVAVYQIIGNSVNLPCTREMVKYGMAPGEFDAALETLISRKLIYVRNSTQEVEIVEPSEIDVEREIKRWMQQKPPGGSALAEVAQLGVQHYVLAHGYNHKNKMTRFLTPAYVDIDNISRVVVDGTLSPVYDSLDGVICYAFPETSQEVSEFRQIASQCKDQRIVFAIPDRPIPVKAVIWRLLALRDISESPKARQVDARAEALVRLYREDAWQELHGRLSQVTTPSIRVQYYWAGKRVPGIDSEQSLSSLASDMMEQVFRYTPIVNNELINKNRPTVTSRRARNDVVDLLLQGYSNIRQRLRSSQEEFMFETLFIQTGLLDEETGEVGTGRTIFKPALEAVEAYLLGAKAEPKELRGLVNMLTAPPFGVRRGVIPVLLAACVVKYRQYITIRELSGVDCRIDAALLDRIAETPEQYVVKLDDWNEALEKFATGLARLFGQQFPDNVFFSNRFGDLADQMFRWFTGLPRVARETRSVSQAARALRHHARLANRNPKQVLFGDLPRSLGYECVLEHVGTLLDTVKSAKDELDHVLDGLGEKVQQALREFFSAYGVEGESLISLARNMVDRAPAGDLQSWKWGNLFAYISGFNGYDEMKFTHGLAQVLTGVRLEDWVDRTWDEFSNNIRDLENSRQEVASAEAGAPKAELVLLDAPNGPKRIPISDYAVSDLGRMLQSHLESAIENFGDAISPLERRQILLELFQKFVLGG